jgi:cyclic pyranopterin monophosphate synthase
MNELSHVDPAGKAKMVDVGSKQDTHRVARAAGTIKMKSATLDAIRGNLVAKGDVLGVAKLAGIMAAKRTDELIPLCHPLPLHHVEVSLTLDSSIPGVRDEATTETVARTGVEMEALTAVSVALLTVYDMAKAIDRDMVIGGIVLLAKTGGKSGPWSSLVGTGSAP